MVEGFVSLDAALKAAFGAQCAVARRTAVSGGDINRAYRLTLRDGGQVFMKANRSMPEAFFRTEADGLAAIARTGAIGAPRVLGLGADPTEGAFLLLEWCGGGARSDRFWETFGRELAAMHRADTADLAPGGPYGLARDNYIGATPQRNAPKDRWVAFFRECRLAPQFRAADRWFDAADRRRIASLLDRLDALLEEPERPSLLHGDLWSGNFLTGPDGRAWLIDPAAYVGCAEADLAMTELFGGFHPAFYGAYREANPLRPDYERRRDLYNLYHLLNHLNLFGGGYLGAVRRVIGSYVQ